MIDTRLRAYWCVLRGLRGAPAANTNVHSQLRYDLNIFGLCFETIARRSPVPNARCFGSPFPAIAAILRNFL